MPDWTCEYIIAFLNDNKNFEDFKKLYILSLSDSWSGSEIPLILEKIDFLRQLKNILKGTDFIDHRKYLEERCRELEKYKEIVELNEYLENEQYT